MEPRLCGVAQEPCHASSGRLHPEIGLTAAWEDTPDVLAALCERGVRGNAVLTLPRAA